jgi:PQQ-like domain
VSATVVIDLGEDWTLADEQPVGQRRRPPSRVLLAAFVLVAVVLLTGGSAAPRPPFVALGSVPTQGTSATEVGDGAVFVGAQTLGGRTVTRYPLAGGARVWTVTVPGPPEYLRYLPGPRTLMVESYDVEANQARVAMLDAATGRRLWVSSGQMMLEAPDTEPGALLFDPDDAGAGVATYTDLRTGRALWSRAVPAGTQLVATDDGTRPDASGYVLAQADGTVTLLAGRTGAVLVTGQVGRLAPDNPAEFDPDRQSIVNVVGDRLMVLRQMGALKATLDSYTLPSLSHQWTLSGALSGFPSGCGPVLCLAESNELVGLEPATGTTRWHTPGWAWAEDLGNGRLLGYRPGNGQQVGVLDAATGRLLLDLGDWTPVQGTGMPELLTAPDRGNYRYTWFAALDPDTPGVRVLTRLTGVGTSGCDPHGDLLVCRTLDARLQVWRYQR